MKIVSKFKDFYDYLVTGYDTDETIKYLRETKVMGDQELEKLFSHVKQARMILAFSKARVNLMRTKIGRKNEDLVAFLEFTVIGIYPEVRIIPTITVYDISGVGLYYDHNGAMIDKRVTLIPLEIFKEEGVVFDKERLNLISGLYSLELVDKDSALIYNRKYESIRYSSRKLTSGEVDVFKSPEDLVITCPDLFFTLGAPIFVAGLGRGEGIEVNPCLTNLPKDKVDLDWMFQDPSNIRYRVEQFIIENSSPKIVEPDNNTKIQAAGFDLKTSFRKC